MILVPLVLVLAAASAPAPEAAAEIVHAVAVRGDVALLGRSDGLLIVDATEQGRGKVLGRLRTARPVLAVATPAGASFALLASGASGLLIVDVSDPAAPRAVGVWNEAVEVVDVIAADPAIAYLAAGHAGVRVLDLADPARPMARTSLPARGRVRRLALEGDRLATAEVAGGVRLFDVSRPFDPRQRALCSPAAAVHAVAWRDGALLAGAGREGILVLQGTGTDPCRVVAGLPLAGDVREIAVDRGVAVVSAGAHGVHVLDVATPGAPLRTASVVLPHGMGAGRAVATAGRSIVAAAAEGIAILDLTTPSAPRIVAPAERRLRVIWR